MFKYKAEDIYFFMYYIKVMINVRDNAQDVISLITICRERNIATKYCLPTVTQIKDILS